jgi:hypothetical protein
LCDTVHAIQVGVRAVGQGLRQATVQIHDKRRRPTVDGLLQTITLSVIGVRDHGRPPADRFQAVGKIIFIAVDAIRQQIPVAIPGVRDAIHARQAVARSKKHRPP